MCIGACDNLSKEWRKSNETQENFHKSNERLAVDGNDSDNDTIYGDDGKGRRRGTKQCQDLL